MDWTEESINRLRSFWQDGLSTAEIGRRMQITKNAVVGKAHRLTLPPRPSPIRKVLELASTGLQSQRTALDDKAGPTLAAPGRTMPGAAVPGSATPGPMAQRPLPVAAPVPMVLQPMPAPVIAVPVVAVPERPTALPVAANVQALRPSAPQQSPTRPFQAEQATPAPLRAVSPTPRRSGMTCCWPLGEPGTKAFHFCGGEPTPGKPYCAEHAAVAYVKIRDRRDSVA